MICILHGYLLEGSGSNLWTRSVIQSLCRNGETVHLVCQENHPEIYDFIARAFEYQPNGLVRLLLRRRVPYPGRCIMHKPKLGETLPVYVWDKYQEFSNPVPMVALPDKAIDDYLQRNMEVVKRVVCEYGVKVLHANHAVLMSVVAQRVSAETATPFAIMPHGSAIEYAIKKDARFLQMAQEAFSATNRIFVIGQEIRQRISDVFSNVSELEKKMTELNLGVDTGLFKPLANKTRQQNIDQLKESISPVPRGKSPDLSKRMLEALSDRISLAKMQKALAMANEYCAKCPDEDIEKKLDAVDWQNEQIALYVGRLIAGKGLQSVFAALPFILEKKPLLRLLVVGHGPLREALEALLWAFETGNGTLVENIVSWGSALEGSQHLPFAEVEEYFSQLQNRDEWDAYLEKAQKYVRSDRVVFTGYLTHRQLRYLFPCCDLAIFPSVVKEAGPLVFLEALASGVYPLGTYFGGMAASIDLVSKSLPVEDAPWMKLSAAPEQTISDMVTNVPKALDIGAKYRETLRRLAVERFDWTNVSQKLTNELNALAGESMDYR